MPANIQQPALTGEDDFLEAISETMSESLAEETGEKRPVFVSNPNPDASVIEDRFASVAKPASVFSFWNDKAAVETPKEMFAREIAAAQSLLDDAQKKQTDAKAEYHRRTLEIKAAQERLQALQDAQKDNVSRIKAQEKAIRVHRQTVFGLQEAGR